MLVILQHNSPVGNVDLQGRTALHDAGKTDSRTQVYFRLHCKHPNAHMNVKVFNIRGVKQQLCMIMKKLCLILLVHVFSVHQASSRLLSELS